MADSTDIQISSINQLDDARNLSSDDYLYIAQKSGNEYLSKKTKIDDLYEYVENQLTDIIGGGSGYPFVNMDKDIIECEAFKTYQITADSIIMGMNNNWDWSSYLAFNGKTLKDRGIATNVFMHFCFIQHIRSDMLIGPRIYVRKSQNVTVTSTNNGYHIYIMPLLPNNASGIFIDYEHMFIKEISFDESKPFKKYTCETDVVVGYHAGVENPVKWLDVITTHNGRQINVNDMPSMPTTESGLPVFYLQYGMRNAYGNATNIYDRYMYFFKKGCTLDFIENATGSFVCAPLL